MTIFFQNTGSHFRRNKYACQCFILILVSLRRAGSELLPLASKEKKRKRTGGESDNLPKLCWQTRVSMVSVEDEICAGGNQRIENKTTIVTVISPGTQLRLAQWKAVALVVELNPPLLLSLTAELQPVLGFEWQPRHALVRLCIRSLRPQNSGPILASSIAAHDPNPTKGRYRACSSSARACARAYARVCIRAGNRSIRRRRSQDWYELDPELGLSCFTAPAYPGALVLQVEPELLLFPLSQSPPPTTLPVYAPSASHLSPTASLPSAPVQLELRLGISWSYAQNILASFLPTPRPPAHAHAHAQAWDMAARTEITLHVRAVLPSFLQPNTTPPTPPPMPAPGAELNVEKAYPFRYLNVAGNRQGETKRGEERWRDEGIGEAKGGLRWKLLDSEESIVPEVLEGRNSASIAFQRYEKFRDGDS
ncbi:hypothetical protein GALMADRAFT_214993 [Galerina marginata CBS 339.88]|uniref:Uncharacterized protein n=1 Tax=Galerina marginata (strain CBS 339.88) TaxID=685588 RepID=A0A067SPH6_GALM3|nr:hypothetical protein GALMADRAFT_214993 [Galerina marginata CBS 339.88]